jgi:5-methyltetrahydropteroyltriglutamate--homocysteine methyltransferase
MKFETLLSTTVVGSHPQPEWLVDRDRLIAHGVPRVGAADIWTVPKEHRRAAQDDATIVAIHEMETAGIDIISDGEIGRESYSNHFAMALQGLDGIHPHIIMSSNVEVPVPRVVSAIRRVAPIEVERARFLKAHTTRRTKITLPGPFTLAQQAKNEYYSDAEEMTMAFAEAVNAEARDLAATGIDVIQFDEPWLRKAPQEAQRYAVRALNKTVEGLAGTVTTAIHLCFGYGALVAKDKPRQYAFLEELASTGIEQISIEAAQAHLDLQFLKALMPKTVILGVIDLSNEAIETPETVAERIRAALKYVPADRLIPAPDCGMKYMSRRAAFGKLRALAQGATIVRRELTQSAR